MKYAVIGNPIDHSLSPVIHNYWFKKYNIEAGLEKLLLKTEDLEKIRDHKLHGFVVTVPHKSEIMKYVDEIEGEADRIGAINIVYTKGRRLVGANSDGDGFFLSVVRKYPDFDFKGKIITIFGAGGAAKSIIFKMLDLGVKEVRIINRSKVSFEGNVKVFGFNDCATALKDADMVINATILGLKNTNQDLNINFDLLPKDAIIVDIVYNPLKTKLLIEAESRGIKVLSGLGMLIEQARYAFIRWTGIFPEATVELEEILLGHL